ncbi:hypothetical protein M885DRAFT_276431 [Pelagophyceae sp. CCMP2097]|nr:hypothetical protein M885DRAFT_276431 [Pelagophyceae sp. CCMP2097]
MPYKMLLRDGRNVELTTASGAAAYIGAEPEFISKNLRQLRQPSVMALQAIGVVADTLMPDALAQVASLQKKALVEYSKKVLKKHLVDGSKWMTRGDMGDDAALMDAVIPWCKDGEFLNMAMEGSESLFSSVFRLSECAVPMPEASCEHLLYVMHFAAATLHRLHGILDAISKEAVVSVLGVIHKYPDNDETAVGVLTLFCEDGRFIRKRFKPSEAAFASLSQALFETRRSGGRGELVEALAKIRHLGRSSQQGPLDGGASKVCHMCRHCSTPQLSLPAGTKLLQCARCSFAYYCSKACQKADWKAGHKAVCKPAGGAATSVADVKSTDALVWGRVWIFGKRVANVWQTSLNVADELRPVELYAHPLEAAAGFEARRRRARLGLENRLVKGTF